MYSDFSRENDSSVNICVLNQRIEKINEYFPDVFFCR